MVVEPPFMMLQGVTVFPTCLLGPEKVELCTKVSKLFDMLNFEILNALLSKSFQ